jgi:superfamily II DNA or RNA helicase
MFSVGTLVKAREREWVVLPESTDDLLILRPLGGTDDEVTGIYLPIESVSAAEFDLPDPARPGDYRSCRLLRNAVRFGFRSSAGPFRSFGHLAVEPRPYQLVPLLVALKLDPVRVLIADDVGIGKTIEACLIARELLDRGEITRMAVLCPPHLAEQWQKELMEKFHIEAELVLAGTATRLERPCRPGESLFDYHPYVIVSTDFIKSDRRRDDFLRTCPELVIVDEAHTCASGFESRGRHQRFELVRKLSARPDRNMILVTATPHSGNEAAFRSLLSILDESFEALPEDLRGSHNEAHRRRLAAHFIQRRRADIERFLNAETPFPVRKDKEESYTLSPEYKKLMEKAIRYARESIEEGGIGKFQQRVRWWSALALLRSMASSPAAAAATLRNRAPGTDAEKEDDLDEIGRRTILDLMDNDSAEGTDVSPGSDYSHEDEDEKRVRRRLLEMANEAEKLKGRKDEKLIKATALIEELLKDGFSPIVFCRFIPTAEYVGDALRGKLGRDVEVGVVTGLLPPEEREQRILNFDRSKKRVLVCTDCLSEGINLQEHFNAVMHYDLSWNPTRHEQREGRIDRYGQRSPNVRALTYYGKDNAVDGIVLDLLLRKHSTIRSSLGISVPVPVNTEQIVEAVFEGLLFRGKYKGETSDQLLLPGFEDYFRPQKEELHAKWESAKEREKLSRTLFAQETIKADEVAEELAALRDALGSPSDVRDFFREALTVYGATVTEVKDGSVTVSPADAPTGLREALGTERSFSARFELPAKEGQVYLTRTHPMIEGLAGYVMNTALDALNDGKARRCGVVKTSQVKKMTTLVLVRYRFHILMKTAEIERQLLAEDCRLLGFRGLPANAEWISSEEAEKLLDASPDENVPEEHAKQFLSRITGDYAPVLKKLNDYAKERGEQLLQAHRRVRTASRIKGVSYRVEPQLPADTLGLYTYLPV